MGEQHLDSACVHAAIAELAAIKAPHAKQPKPRKPFPPLVDSDVLRTLFATRRKFTGGGFWHFCDMASRKNEGR